MKKKKKKTKKKPISFCSPTPPPSSFSRLFPHLSFVTGSSRVCHSPFLSCIFVWQIRLLNQTVQRSIYIYSSDSSRHAPLHRMHRPCPLPTTLATFDSSNPVTEHDSHALVRGFLEVWPESFGSLPPVVFYGFSPPIFVVMTCWVEDVNNFLTCEFRRMSFGMRMLLPMYQIKSV
jgi:hypothetical protein